MTAFKCRLIVILLSRAKRRLGYGQQSDFLLRLPLCIASSAHSVMYRFQSSFHKPFAFNKEPGVLSLHLRLKQPSDTAERVAQNSCSGESAKCCQIEKVSWEESSGYRKRMVHRNAVRGTLNQRRLHSNAPHSSIFSDLDNKNELVMLIAQGVSTSYSITLLIP